MSPATVPNSRAALDLIQRRAAETANKAQEHRSSQVDLDEDETQDDFYANIPCTD